MACMRELGDRSSLVNIDTEAEYSSIVGMLNSMDISEDLWIGTLVGSSGGEGYRKWAQCHPSESHSIHSYTVCVPLMNELELYVLFVRKDAGCVWKEIEWSCARI